MQVRYVLPLDIAVSLKAPLMHDLLNLLLSLLRMGVEVTFLL